MLLVMLVDENYLGEITCWDAGSIVNLWILNSKVKIISLIYNKLFYADFF